MTLLDAQAVVAGLLGEPAAQEVATLLRDSDDQPRLSAASMAEVIDVLVRGRSLEPAAVNEKLDWLTLGGLQIVPVDEQVGRLAGALRARHYERRNRPLSLGDCLTLATARFIGDSLATADAPLAAVARLEGVVVVALPNSSGVRP